MQYTPEEIKEKHDSVTDQQVHDLAMAMQNIVPTEKNMLKLVDEVSADGGNNRMVLIALLGSALDWYSYGL